MNLLYLQSGGPTSVINETLRGVIEAGRCFDQVLGARHGLEGVLHEDLVDLRRIDLTRLSRRPAAALGTSRMELYGQPDEVVDRIFSVLRSHRITHVIANGGGDTAESALALSAEAHRRKRDLRVAHAQKTIDNDILCADHTPGYGTAATAVALLCIGNYLDAEACRQVKIDIVMGRVTGWLPAAALLSRDAGIAGPHGIFVPEHHASMNDIHACIGRARMKHGFAHIIISEGYAASLARRAATDLSCGFTLEVLLAGALEREFGQVRIDKYGYTQRSACWAHSSRDSVEARMVGHAAVGYVLEHADPVSAAIVRADGQGYHASTMPVPLSSIATPGTKRYRSLPTEFLGQPGVIRERFIEYVRPLAGAIPELGSLPLHPVSKTLPAYLPKRGLRCASQ